MIRKRPIKRRQDSNIRVTANHQIRFPEVRVLDEFGEMIAVMQTRDAMMQAREADKDLILLNEKASPPVAKIIALSKYKYQQQQKDAESRKKAKAQDLKEVRFTPFMSDGDFQSRLKKVVDFLERGDKVRLSLQFKGRQITKKEFGYEQFDKVLAATTEIASVEMEPKLMGKKLIAQLQPTGKKKHEKNEAKN